MTVLQLFGNIVIFSFREEHPRQSGFVGVLERKSDRDFFKHLRVTRPTFTTLLGIVEDAYGPPSSFAGYSLGPKTALYITLWYLGSKITYREIAEQFGVCESAAHRSVHTIVDILCEVADRFIHWPKLNEIPAVLDEFESLGALPGVIGAVDGCHIHIKAPDATQSDYIDRTLHHSVNLMVVCTADKKKIHTFKQGFQDLPMAEGFSSQLCFIQ